MTTKPPIPASDITPEWIAAFREAMSAHEGVPIRPNPLRPQIEVYSIGRNAWLPQLLPGGGTCFVDFDARNEVMRRVTSK